MTARVTEIPLTSALSVDLTEKRAKAQGLIGQGYRLGSTDDPWDRNWNPLPSLPDTELSRHMTYMWGRSYDLHRNNGYVAGPSTRLAGLVGELVPQFLTKDATERAELSRLWGLWAPQAMSDGVGSFAMFCELLVGNACQGGDVLVPLEHREEIEDGPIPLRVNLVDAWRVANSESKDKDGKTISLGVKKDKGVEVGYFVSRDDGNAPYYFPRIKNGRPGAVLFRRPDPLRRPGQSRSTPIATAYLNNIKDAWDHERAHTRTAGSRARMKAILQATDVEGIKKIFQAAKEAEATDPEMARIIRQSAKATTVETPDATTMILPKWAEYKATPTDTVDPNFTTYMKGQKEAVAPGWGFGREIAFLEMGDANFARARIHFMQAQSEVKRWIRDIASQVGRPLIKLFVQYAWAYGYLSKEPTAEATDVAWHGLPVEYMDLGNEVSAYADAKASGIMSPQAISRRSNTDWELTLREEMDYALAWKNLKEEFGLSDEDIASALGVRKEAPTTSTTQQEPTP